MNVRWSDDGEDDWRRLNPEEQASVARAVEEWAQTGAGLVDAAEGGGVFRLYSGRHVVLFLIDSSTDTMHVIQVRRA